MCKILPPPSLDAAGSDLGDCSDGDASPSTLPPPTLPAPPALPERTATPDALVGPTNRHSAPPGAAVHSRGAEDGSRRGSGGRRSVRSDPGVSAGGGRRESGARDKASRRSSRRRPLLLKPLKPFSKACRFLAGGLSQPQKLEVELPEVELPEAEADAAALRKRLRRESLRAADDETDVSKDKPPRQTRITCSRLRESHGRMREASRASEALHSSPDWRRSEGTPREELQPAKRWAPCCSAEGVEHRSSFVGGEAWEL